MSDLKAPWHTGHGGKLTTPVFTASGKRVGSIQNDMLPTVLAFQTLAARCERLEGALTQVNACLIRADWTHDVNGALDIIKAAFADEEEDKT